METIFGVRFDNIIFRTCDHRMYGRIVGEVGLLKQLVFVVDGVVELEIGASRVEDGGYVGLEVTRMT